ncbi:MAG TPA: sugar phosphate nucleotidyltransferase, partial [Candidatus Sulfotelmatobacter sp.]|nr:sugar phosphate nucleotidyltransferase [Candidatus Sulfotelmatobacter sp.]
LAFHTAHGKPLSVALAHVKDTGRFGRVRLDSTGGIVAFEEKTSAGPGLVNGGVYLMEREVQLRIPVQKCSFERDVLPSLLGGGAVGFVTSGFFVDIGVPADYRRLVRSPGTFLRAIGGRQR